MNNRSSATGPPAPEDQPLLAVLTDLESKGYAGHLRAVEGGCIECLTCRGIFGAGQFQTDLAVRLEGASDPADMLIVLPAVCPHCGAAGALVANYGPEAQPEEAEVLRLVERSPSSPSVGGEGSRQ